MVQDLLGLEAQLGILAAVVAEVVMVELGVTAEILVNHHQSLIQLADMVVEAAEEDMVVLEVLAAMVEMHIIIRLLEVVAEAEEVAMESLVVKAVMVIMLDIVEIMEIANKKAIIIFIQ